MLGALNQLVGQQKVTANVTLTMTVQFTTQWIIQPDGNRLF